VQNKLILRTESSEGNVLSSQGLAVKDIAKTAGTSSERLGACQDGAHVIPRMNSVYV
jgi:hypothetical protein